MALLFAQPALGASAGQSKLKDAKPDALAEAAVDDLLGAGNQAEPALQTALTFEDKVVLIEKVYVPALIDPAFQEAMRSAACAADLRRTRTTNVDLKTAMKEGKCDISYNVNDIYRVPEARLAFVKYVLRSHPDRQEIEDTFRLVSASDVGAKPVGICYRLNFRNDEPMTPVVSNECDLRVGRLRNMSGRHVPAANPLSGADAFAIQGVMFTQGTPIEKARKHEILESQAYLNGISPSSSRAAAVAELSEKLSARLKALEAEANQAATERAEKKKAELAQLSADERRVYEERGAPTSHGPAPRGGSYWRYERSRYQDAGGRTRLVGISWEEFIFDAKGALVDRTSGVQ